MSGIRVDETEDIVSNHSGLNLDDGSNPHGTTKSDVGLGSADNTSDLDKPVSTATQTALDLKYDASNPNGYETPTQLNSRDTNNRDRANHTGSQLSSTISNFASTVLSTVLSGFATSTGLVTAADSVLSAFGKLQGQLNGMVFGRDAKSQIKDADETTTGSSFDEYDSMSFAVTDSATNKFRCNVNFVWGHNSAANDIRVRLMVDGTQQGEEFFMEPADAGTNQRLHGNILRYISNLSIGNHTLSLEYRPATSSRVSRMYQSTLEVWRVE